MKYRAFVPLAVGAAVLLVAQHPFEPQLNALFLGFPGIDKVLHVVGYLFAYTAGHVAARSVVSGPKRQRVLAVTIGLTLAVADESVQWLTPGRAADAMDLLADVSGLMLGWVLTDRPLRGLTVATACVAVCLATSVTWTTHAQLIDYSRALRHERQGDFVRAREYYDRAYRSGLRSAALFNGMAWVEVESSVGDPVAAVEYAQRALAMDPENPDVLDTYGWALQNAGHSADALGYLRRAYAAKPEMFCIHYHLGAAYSATGQRALAEAHYRQQLARVGTREAVLAARALEDLASSR